MKKTSEETQTNQAEDGTDYSEEDLPSDKDSSSEITISSEDTHNSKITASKNDSETNNETASETASESNDETASETETEESTEASIPQSRAASLKAAELTDQIILVEAYGTECEVSLHEKDEDGNWIEVLSDWGYLGSDGVGQASEYCCCTPEGVYSLGQAFGTNPDPGTSVSYIQVDDSWYWVDDPNSSLYNQLVSTTWDGIDISMWNSAEHLSEYYCYDYALAIGYNTDCVPGAGSAFFLHSLSGGPTSGCVTVPSDTVRQILVNLRSDALFVIKNADDTE